MLFYVFFNIGISGQLTVFKDVPEIQPWCRVTATPSQSHIELPPNQWRIQDIFTGVAKMGHKASVGWPWHSEV